MKIFLGLLVIFGLIHILVSHPGLHKSRKSTVQKLREVETILENNLHELRREKVSEHEESRRQNFDRINDKNIRNKEDRATNIDEDINKQLSHQFVTRTSNSQRNAKNQWEKIRKLKDHRKFDTRSEEEEEEEEETLEDNLNEDDDVIIDGTNDNHQGTFDPSKVNPNSDKMELYEAMEIDVNGKTHLIPGLRPQDSQKTYANSHDGHKWTEEQLEQMAENNGRIASKRNFITNTKKFWPEGIVPYKLYNMSASATNVINQAIKQFHDFTCIRWITEDNPIYKNLTNKNMVYFINEEGCWSFVGDIRFSHNVQRLSMSEPGCISVTTAVHEMLHALGGKHEQSRSDRDNYITIDYDNVKDGSSNYNFRKGSTLNNNPYDGESSMQYSLYSFSTNGGQTIRFRDERLEFLATAARGLEFYDIKDTNDAYQCADHCTNPPNCQYGGFVNFNCTCFCPEPLTGATCEEVKTSANCGGIINIDQGETKYIESPNYPSSYPTGLECTWLVKGTPTNLVRATVQYMDVAASSKCDHWIEWRYNLLGQTGPKKCGTNFEPEGDIWDSTPDELRNAMIIRFNSMDSAVQAKTGFKIKLTNSGTGCLSNPCKFGWCSSPEGTDQYTCTCKSGFTGTLCDTLTGIQPISCGFEFREGCIFVDVDDDDFDWTKSMGGTPSPYTGPERPNSGYQYVFMEASSKHENDTAVLASNVTLPNRDWCLTFFYHMRGQKVRNLNVYTRGSTQTKTLVWKQKGDQGKLWKMGTVNIPKTDGLKIYIEAVRGTGFNGDIGLDDVVLSPGECPTDDYTDIDKFNCTFEPGSSCIFQDYDHDDFDWTMGKANTPSCCTGPGQAYQGTYYVYIETSFPRSNNDAAVLTTEGVKIKGTVWCLRFMYHMKGAPGVLQVYASDRGDDYAYVLWELKGHQFHSWRSANVTIPKFVDPTVIALPFASLTLLLDLSTRLTDPDCPLFQLQLATISVAETQNEKQNQKTKA